MTPRSEINKSQWLHAPVLWKALPGLSDYAQTLAAMEASAVAVANDEASEQVWLLEHPPLYTAGTSAKTVDLLQPNRFPVHQTGRGGQYTYHGPGQRVAYVILDVKKRGGDVRAFVAALERWIIATLARFEIKGRTHDDRVGVWVDTANGEAKIAALGIRVRRGVSFHGISLNVDPDLSHFGGIVACGIRDKGPTSFAALQKSAHMQDIDLALRETFEDVFAPVTFQYLRPSTK
jgi:lipoyl(octanoyl) transferase